MLSLPLSTSRWWNILHRHPLIRHKDYLRLHILLLISRTYHVITQTYSPWNHRGEYSSSWYLDYTQVYFCLPLLSCTLRPTLYPQILLPEKSRGEYSSFMFLSFCSRFTSACMTYCAPWGPSMSSPKFSCPCKPQGWISFILIASFSLQSRCFEGNTFHFPSFPDCRPHLPHKANPLSLKLTGLNFIHDYPPGTHQDLLGSFNSSLFKRL